MSNTAYDQWAGAMSKVLAIMAIAAAAATLAMVMGDVVDEGVKQQVIEKAEKAREALEKAQKRMESTNGDDGLTEAMNGGGEVCPAWRLSEVEGMVQSIETEILQNRVGEASNQAHMARFSIDDCLASSSESTSAFPQASTSSPESVGYLLQLAMSLIKSISTLLNQLESNSIIMPNITMSNDDATTPLGDVDTTMVEKSGSKRVGCKRDGTICQFSTCGRGKNLPSCAMGFAYGVTGGAFGPTYIVSRSDDDPLHPQPGSLRYGVGLGGTKHGVWITFAHNMIIALQSMLWIRSSTTIDGRGYNITITGKMIVVGGAKNVILHNFQINSMQQSDTIHIFAGSTKVWVDHITSFNAKLGLVSVVQRATDVTISNCKLSNDNFNMLLGAADTDISDKNLRVTVYRNWFKDSKQRMPHCRWGFCHVMNNLYTNWGYYAIGGRVQARIRSEANAFIASRRSEVTPWFPGASTTAAFDGSALIRSFNDLLLNGTTFHQFNPNPNSIISPPYPSSVAFPAAASPHSLPSLLRSCAGALPSAPLLRRCLSIAS